MKRRVSKPKKVPSEMPPPHKPSIEILDGSTLTIRLTGPCRVYGWRVLILNGGNAGVEISSRKLATHVRRVPPVAT